MRPNHATKGHFKRWTCKNIKLCCFWIETSSWRARQSATFLDQKPNSFRAFKLIKLDNYAFLHVIKHGLNCMLLVPYLAPYHKISTFFNALYILFLPCNFYMVKAIIFSIKCLKTNKDPWNHFPDFKITNLAWFCKLLKILEGHSMLYKVIHYIWAESCKNLTK